jgi:hypothetical protein
MKVAIGEVNWFGRFEDVGDGYETQYQFLNFTETAEAELIAHYAASASATLKVGDLKIYGNYDRAFDWGWRYDWGWLIINKNADSLIIDAHISK